LTALDKREAPITRAWSYVNFDLMWTGGTGLTGSLAQPLRPCLEKHNFVGRLGGQKESLPKGTSKLKGGWDDRNSDDRNGEG
jgi:hypothetical protein